METWFIIICSFCIAALLKPLFHRRHSKKLPPGPPFVTGNLLWAVKSFSEVELLLRDLRLKYGPLITLYTGSRPSIFIASHSLAHRTLVQNGAVFSDRPKPQPAARLITRNQRNISSASYGPTWRLFRRNLASEILHPSRVKSYSWARRWVLGILMRRLQVQPSAVKVVDHFQYSMFCLLVLMCFGDKLDESQIKQIESVQRRFLLNFNRFLILGLWPRLGKILFRNRWKELRQLMQDQERVLIPLIKARIEVSQHQLEEEDNKDTPQQQQGLRVLAYVDTLVHLQLPEEENRKLTHEDMVSLCSEFLNAGTDTTSTALQWIMANLVKYPQIQDKLYKEITGVVGPPTPPPRCSGADEMLGAAVKEEDLEKMPYLKAVVLEGLRRHPPGHFVLPHAVTKEVELEGYVVPKDASVNFMVAEMGLDPTVWDDPMEFKPDRFLNATNNDHQHQGISLPAFDITGSKEIKMMPFGAGRRICPGVDLALLHLEYFVANLIWYFEWMAADGVDVDLSEKQEFTIVMKNPLLANLSPRQRIRNE